MLPLGWPVYLSNQRMVSSSPKGSWKMAVVFDHALGRAGGDDGGESERKGEQTGSQHGRHRTIG